ncbi:MAG: M28 family peptidase [Ferruginibacter sp.]|nr:M28 family peptidase [Cytophagales bacterium]
MKKWIVCLAGCWTGCLLVAIPSRAQDLGRVRATIDTLCSPGMYGRGYVKEGEKIAARYLARRFAAIGLHAFGTASGEPYFQPFSLDVNTFPRPIRLKIDKKTLVTGQDYLLNAISRKGRGTGKVRRLDTLILTDESARQRFLQSKTKDQVVVYEQKHYARLVELPPDLLNKMHEAKALIELQNSNKLTASLSPSQLSHPLFEVKAAGFNPNAQRVKFRAYARLIAGYSTQNVIGYVRGTAEPDSFVVISAHYDHLGTLGRAYFPGANDNASGISMLLELAHHFAAHPPRYSVAFVAFGAEEAGLVGSKFYVEHPLFPLRQIRFLINLDLVGTGDDGLMVVNGTAMTPEFDRLSRINQQNGYFPTLSKRANAPNSDHFYFAIRGVRSVFLYTLGGIKAYHDVDDRPETLPLTKYKEVFGLLRQFIE